jgi:hypothetical protein
MKLETTNIKGIKYVIDKQKSPIAIYTACGKQIYCVGDRISIRDHQKKHDRSCEDLAGLDKTKASVKIKDIKELNLGNLVDLMNLGTRPYTDGVITKINRSDSDLFFVVTMNNGKEEVLGLKKIKKVISCSEFFRIRHKLFMKQSEWQVEVDDIRSRYGALVQQKAWSTLFMTDQIVELYFDILRLKQKDYGQWDLPECQDMYNGIYNDLVWAYHNMIADRHRV